MIQVSKSSKQIVVLYASSVIGLLFGVLCSVLNTRSLSPELFGDVRYVQNIISFVSSLLLFGYFVSGSRLLALSKDESYSRRIRGAMVAILLATIVVLSLVMLVLYVISLFNGKENLTPLYLSSVFLGSNVILLNYVNTTAQGDNHIGRLAIARFLPSGVYLVIAFLVYRYFGCSPTLMISLFNGTAVLVLGWIIVSTKPSFHNLRESLKFLYEENKSYGFNVYLGSLAGVSTSYIAGITLGSFCADNANVGFYTLALSLATPLTMLPSIIGTTYFRRFAEENRINNKIFKYSVALTALSLIVFVAAIRFIVGILYDESYSVVAEYASWLAIGTSLHGFGDMINRFLGAHGQGRQIRNAAIICGLVIIFGSFLFVYYWNVNGAILTKNIGSLSYFLAMVVYYLKFIKSANAM